MTHPAHPHPAHPLVPPAPPPPAAPRRKRPRWQKWLLALGILIVVGLIGAELFARFYLGLGDPPLTMSDPEIEYLHNPNQTCYRFGHLIHINAYSMRSDDFPKTKSHPKEKRVLVLGDSIINGGAQTNQSQLAT